MISSIHLDDSVVSDVETIVVESLRLTVFVFCFYSYVCLNIIKLQNANFFCESDNTVYERKQTHPVVWSQCRLIFIV